MHLSEKYLSQAAAAQNQKHYRQAIDCYDKAEQSGCQTHHLYFHRGACHYNLKHNTLAIHDLEKALQLNPEDAETANLLGNAFYNNNEFDEAIERYSRALYYNDKNYTSLHWRLLARLQLKDEEGKIINKAAAQHDADMLTPVAHQFYQLTSKEGKPLEIVAFEIGDDGTLNFKVKEKLTA